MPLFNRPMTTMQLSFAPSPAVPLPDAVPLPSSDAIVDATTLTRIAQTGAVQAQPAPTSPRVKPRRGARTTAGAQPRLQYFSPSSQPPSLTAACTSRPLPSRPSRPNRDSSTDVVLQNIVTMTSSHSGIGLSTTAAMLAMTLSQRGRSCALIDADFDSGCLDLLLGVERESGLRFNQINAPLGKIEGRALNDELIDWEGVRVLPYNTWTGLRPEWWEVQAVIRALAEANDVVIVDAGLGEFVETMPELQHGMQVVGVELSVMGLARVRAHRARLSAWECSPPRLIGIAPRGAPRGRGIVSIDEAESYLVSPVMGPIYANTSLCGDVLDGLGIRAVPKNCRKAISSLADAVERALHCESADCG